MGVVFLRSLFLYVLLIIFMRTTGKRQIGQLQPYELVLALIVADMVAVPIADVYIPLWYGIVPVISVFVVESVVTYLSLKSQKFRRAASGHPSILVENGIIRQDELRKQRVSLTDLEEQMREEGVSSFAQVRLVILETNGRFSIFPHAANRPATAKDLSLSPDNSMTWSIVLDGHVDKINLQHLGRDETWLEAMLRQQGYANVTSIFHAESNGNSLYVQERQPSDSASGGKGGSA